MKNSPQSRGQFDDPFDFIALHQAQSVRNFELRVYFGEAAYRDQNVVQIRLRALLVSFADVRRDRDSRTTKLRCKSVQLFAREAASQAVHVYGKLNSELSCLEVAERSDRHPNRSSNSRARLPPSKPWKIRRDAAVFARPCGHKCGISCPDPGSPIPDPGIGDRLYRAQALAGARQSVRATSD